MFMGMKGNEGVLWKWSQAIDSKGFLGFMECGGLIYPPYHQSTSSFLAHLSGSLLVMAVPMDTGVGVLSVPHLS